jgi:hypothetical protein
LGRSLPQLDFTFSNYENIKSRLIASNAIATFTIVEELDFGDRGYFRARVTLSNEDFLEVAEYFKTEAIALISDKCDLMQMI